MSQMDERSLDHAKPIGSKTVPTWTMLLGSGNELERARSRANGNELGCADNFKVVTNSGCTASSASEENPMHSKPQRNNEEPIHTELCKNGSNLICAELGTDTTVPMREENRKNANSLACARSSMGSTKSERAEPSGAIKRPAWLIVLSSEGNPVCTRPDAGGVNSRCDIPLGDNGIFKFTRSDAEEANLEHVRPKRSNIDLGQAAFCRSTIGLRFAKSRAEAEASE